MTSQLVGLVGDDALKEFAAVMCEGLRPGDAPCRWGGEEFVVVLPEADRDDALRAAGRIRTTEETHSFSFVQGGRMTCSIGISTYPDDSCDLTQLLKLADQSVYEAKRRGRNQVVGAKPATDLKTSRSPSAGRTRLQSEGPPHTQTGFQDTQQVRQHQLQTRASRHTAMRRPSMTHRQSRSG